MLCTTGFNSIRTLSARLRYLQALSGGLLSSLPLELRLRGKSTTLSRRTPIYYVDLTLRSDSTLAEAIATAREDREARQAAGLDQRALDDAARAGFALGEFEESEEEGAAVVEEFYSVDREALEDVVASPMPLSKPELADKLRQKAAKSWPVAAGDTA